MSPISSISPRAAQAAPTPATAANAPAKAVPAPTKAASEPTETTAPTVAAEVAAQQSKTNAALATSYRNAFGDSVSITGIVVKDRDGDGGVGLPAPKAPVPGK